MSADLQLSPETASGQGPAAAPPPPRSIEETGLAPSFIADLILKQVLFAGEFSLADIAATTGLPVLLMDKGIEILRREKMVEVKGTDRYLRTTYRYAITEGGRVRGGQLMDICSYTGPAPVTLEAYRRQAAAQSISPLAIDQERVRQAFADLVVEDSLLDRLGPAVAAGKPIFLYGFSGNGKTAIAETIGDLLPGTVYVPHSLLVGGQLITIFDQVNHRPMSPAAPDADRRWVPVRRPVIKTGGEFTLRMLDLEFNPVAKFYEAPLQVKANHGLFIIDDFGRQPVDPQVLLNRWIVSLDRAVDFLSLHTGMKFDIPFDQLVIFATNRDPHAMLDGAFLRRIRYKIRVERPNEQGYERIFRQVCASCGLPFDSDVFAYLMEHYYRRLGIPADACHPRDLIEQILDQAAYLLQPPRLTRSAIDAAWENYFVSV